jgi:hypothetical protein
MRVRNLILVICLVIMGATVLWPVFAMLPIGPGPADITIMMPSFRLYIPLTTTISASVVLTLFFWYMRK